MFVEKKENPQKIVLEADNRNNAIKEIERVGGENYIRELQVGVVVRPDIAYSIGEWLIDKAKSMGVKKNKNNEEKGE